MKSLALVVLAVVTGCGSSGAGKAGSEEPVAADPEATASQPISPHEHVVKSPPSEEKSSAEKAVDAHSDREELNELLTNVDEVKGDNETGAFKVGRTLGELEAEETTRVSVGGADAGLGQ